MEIISGQIPVEHRHSAVVARLNPLGDFTVGFDELLHPRRGPFECLGAEVLVLVLQPVLKL